MIFMRLGENHLLCATKSWRESSHSRLVGQTIVYIPVGITGILGITPGTTPGTTLGTGPIGTTIPGTIGCIGIVGPIPKAAIGVGFEFKGAIGATAGIPTVKTNIHLY